MRVCGWLAPLSLYCVVSPLSLQAMNSSDDEDFFAHTLEVQEELMSFNGYEGHRPPEELLPEAEMVPEAEQIQVGIEDHESSPLGWT